MTTLRFKVSAFLKLTVILCGIASFYQLWLSPVVSLPHSQPMQANVSLSECDRKKDTNTSNGEVLREMIRGSLNQSDDRLMDLIPTNYLIPPVAKAVPYKLDHPSEDPSKGQSAVVKKIFKGQRNGFFIECGALDGETRSNTLSLEKDLGWQGLLIEGDPSNFKLLRKKKRKAWLADCCLAIHPYPHVIDFLQDFNLGQIIDPNSPRRKHVKSLKVVKRQCLPIYSLLKAINIRKVDYFSLDVEGFEFEVLRTIPFDKVQIKVLSVEFKHIKGGSGPLLTFMKRKGYRVLTKVVDDVRRQANDFIFVHESLKNLGEFPPVTHTVNAK